MVKEETITEKQSKEALENITPEEQENIQQISDLLKSRKTDEAIALIRNLIGTSKNGELVRQYARLLQRLTEKKQPPPPPQKEDPFQVKVEKPKVTFKDIIGAKKLKKKLTREMVLMIRDREGYIKHHLKPSGILLYGPPGTGKSFLCEALAGEFHANIIRPDLATLFSQWVGETEKNIKKMVDLGKQNEPCVIFVDEVDAKIRDRSKIEARGESAVNLGATTQFLETMQDVHTENNQVIFAAATNRIWDVDSAAKRPGRFGDHIYVPPPTLKDRFILFVHYLKTIDRKNISPLGYLRLSIATTKYSPADIEEICIKCKKDLRYKNYENLVGQKGGADYFEKKISREEYLMAKSSGMLPQRQPEVITTGEVIKVIKSEFKKSSLDDWYIESQKALIGWEETAIEKQKGLILTKTFKKKVKHEGSMTKEEQKRYKDMIKDIKKSSKRGWYIWLLRYIARLG